jgi:hypothetical protein
MRDIFIRFQYFPYYVLSRVPLSHSGINVWPELKIENSWLRYHNRRSPLSVQSYNLGDMEG